MPLLFNKGIITNIMSVQRGEVVSAILEMRKIKKVYQNVVANYDVDFLLEEGEIHALMGENGAGKSTLMKILFGMETPDDGEILIRGEKVVIGSPLEAIQSGIGMVHQHFMLAEGLTVTENVILGDEPLKRGFINKGETSKKVKEALEKYHFNLNPDEKVGNLSVSAKQKVEIVKALIRGAKILILDEPTAVLAPQETNELFEELLNLKKQGYTIIFISHKLDEVKKICDRITIMRKGRSVGVFDLEKITAEDISKLMIGRVVSSNDLIKPAVKIGKPVLEAKDVRKGSKSGKPVLEDINIALHEGEILGVAGVEGNGQSDLVNIITGSDKNYEGKIQIAGQDIGAQSTKKIRDLGLSYIPEDRFTYGVASSISIEENMISTTYEEQEMSGRVLQKRSKISNYAKALIKEYSIKVSSEDEAIQNLSGGNVQKVVVARELGRGKKVLIANQPTRGIDVGSAMFIRQKLLDFKKEKAGILLLSTDMSELFSLSDKIMVMYGGRITAFFDHVSEVTEEMLGWYMLGVKKMEKDELERRIRGEK